MGLSYLATNPEGQRWVITRENTESVDDTDTNTANTKKNEAYQNVVNIANNTIVPTDTNGDLNLNSNGTGQVLINGRQVATDTDALMYAIVFGG